MNINYLHLKSSPNQNKTSYHPGGWKLLIDKNSNIVKTTVFKGYLAHIRGAVSAVLVPAPAQQVDGQFTKGAFSLTGQRFVENSSNKLFVMLLS